MEGDLGYDVKEAKGVQQATNDCLDDSAQVNGPQRAPIRREPSSSAVVSPTHCLQAGATSARRRLADKA